MQARAAECSGMARVGAARASAQRCAHAAAALATSHGQRQPERGHSSCLFQRGTLGGRPVGWGEETTVVRRHSPEHGFLRDVVELAHLEVRWSSGRADGAHGVMCGSFTTHKHANGHYQISTTDRTHAQTVTPSTRHSHLARITPASFKCSQTCDAHDYFYCELVLSLMWLPDGNVPKARVAARATHTCTQATQFELIFPTASRGVRIERALAGCSPPGLMNALTAALL